MLTHISSVFCQKRQTKVLLLSVIPKETTSYVTFSVTFYVTNAKGVAGCTGQVYICLFVNISGIKRVLIGRGCHCATPWLSLLTGKFRLILPSLRWRRILCGSSKQRRLALVWPSRLVLQDLRAACVLFQQKSHFGNKSNGDWILVGKTTTQIGTLIPPFKTLHLQAMNKGGASTSRPQHGGRACADPGFWSGRQRSFDPMGPWDQNLLKTGGFSLKLPQSCMILKRFWGQGGRRAPWVPLYISASEEGLFYATTDGRGERPVTRVNVLSQVSVISLSVAERRQYRKTGNWKKRNSVFFPSKTWIVDEFWHFCSQKSTVEWPTFCQNSSSQHAIIFYGRNWISIFGIRYFRVLPERPSCSCCLLLLLWGGGGCTAVITTLS